MKRGCLVACALLLGVVFSCGLLAFLSDHFREKMANAAAEKFKAVHDVKELYLTFYRDHGRPPANLEDLEPYAAEYPKGFGEIRSGRWVVLWGTPLTDNPRGGRDRVLAYEKDLPTQRGWVIMGDNSGIVLSFEEVNQEREETATLREIAHMYLAHCDDRKRPPGALEDLKLYAGEGPEGYRAIEQGRWVVRWGTEPSDSRQENYDRVIAYQAKAAANVGWVLTADGCGHLMGSKELRDFLEVVPVGHEVWRLYAEYHRRHRRAPGRLDDLEPYRYRYPRGFRALQEGTWTVRWGTEITNDPNRDAKRVLAYEAKVPTTTLMGGGWVVRADNSTLTMDSFEHKRTLEAEREGE